MNYQGKNIFFLRIGRYRNSKNLLTNFSKISVKARSLSHKTAVPTSRTSTFAVTRFNQNTALHSFDTCPREVYSWVSRSVQDRGLRVVVRLRATRLHRHYRCCGPESFTNDDNNNTWRVHCLAVPPTGQHDWPAAAAAAAAGRPEGYVIVIIVCYSPRRVSRPCTTPPFKSPRPRFGATAPDGGARNRARVTRRVHAESFGGQDEIVFPLKIRKKKKSFV